VEERDLVVGDRGEVDLHSAVKAGVEDIGMASLRLYELEYLNWSGARSAGIRLRHNKRTVHDNLPARLLGLLRKPGRIVDPIKFSENGTGIISIRSIILEPS